MFAKWLRAGFTAGRVTTSYPKNVATLRGTHGTWNNVVRMVAHCKFEPDECIAICPTGAICSPDGVSVQVDAGACIGCGLCVTAFPDVFSWSDRIDLTARHRSQLIQSVDGEVEKNDK